VGAFGRLTTDPLGCDLKSLLSLRHMVEGSR
jgi:hypothetical protein